MKRLMAARMALPALLVACLAGCSSDGGIRARVDAALQRLDSAVAQLGEELDGNRLRNAQLIKQYAAKVATQKPDLRDLTRVLAQEATRDGTLYRGLESRLKEVRASVPPEGADQNAYNALADEINSLAAASAPDEFDRALSDPLNVLADLSDGQLPRVDSISAGASRSANSAADFGPGSQLVGNPNYGQWQSRSDGTSFWVWYGQFALMRDLLGGPRIGYGAWAGGRDYSYYHDYGRRNYTSPSARRQQTQVESTARRKFSSEGRTFRSPYSRQRQGASTRVARQKFASSSGSSRFGSSSRPASTSGSRATSSRPASMRGFGGSSRGPRRGK